jgi:hypothetical protein
MCIAELVQKPGPVPNPEQKAEDEKVRRRVDDFMVEESII